VSDRGRFIVLLALIGATFARAEEPRIQDPTRPYEAAAGAVGTNAPTPGSTLTAVIVSPTRKIAVIGGRIYHEGDRVDGALITRIEPGAVHLKRGDGQLLLRLRDKGVQDQ
jgi:hypothetical protein